MLCRIRLRKRSDRLFCDIIPAKQAHLLRSPDMRFRKFALITSAIALLSAFAFAQVQLSADAAEKAKKKKEMDERVVQMLDQTIAESNALRLPQNRAVVYAMSGDLYWKFDSKRSRELFRAAAAEIVTYNFETEKEKRESTDIGMPERFDPNDPRAEVLQLTAGRDADLALELLVQTRSASLAEAMAKISMTDVKATGLATGGGLGSGIGSGSGTGTGIGDLTASMDKARASQEIMLEERFRMMAAFSDPDRAIKAIKDSLAKGISTSVISLLQVVFRADEKKAADLAGEVVSKILSTDLTKNNNDLNGVVNFLQYAARPVTNPNPKVKFFSFSETQVRDIANKLANTFLQSATTPAITSALTRSLATLEKVLPERTLLLKQRDAQNRKSQPPDRNTQGRARFYDPGMTPEDVLAQAAKLPNETDRMMAYQAVAARISQITDDARAKKLIDQIPDERIRTNAAEQYESVRISRLTATDKLDEARKAINTLTDRKIKVQKLVALATQFQRKGGEINIESARSFMVDAKALTNPFPDDEDELGNLMEVIKGYAVVEPNEAFRLVEPIIDQFNEMIQATAVLSKYNKRDQSFKKGELVMRVNGNIGGGLLVFRYVQQMQLLGKVDLERMSVLVDRFQRSDSRTIMKLYILQGYLRNAPAGPSM